MDRSDLEPLDRASLIETVLRQEATIKRLAAELAALQAPTAPAVCPDPASPPKAESAARPHGVWLRLGLAALAILAGVAGYLLTPPPDLTAASGWAGFPRLALFGLAGVLLALTAPAPRVLRSLRGTAVTNRVYVILGLGLAACLAVCIGNGGLLLRSIAHPLGPALWIGSMVLLFVVLEAPHVRRIGWGALWPQAAGTDDGFARWRWLGHPLLVLVIALAAITRLPALGEIPLGINPDEGDRAISAFNVLRGRAPASWFDSGWYFINMVYFRVLAVSFALFGTDVEGGRVLSAFSGIGFVATVAWFGVRNFGWRVGLFAATFAAGLGVSLQHSRLITEAGPTLLLWALSIGGFLEGARTGRLSAWALAGLTGGLGLYFYPSARLWVVGAVLTVAVVLVYQRDRRLLLGAGVAALATLIATAPFLVHLWLTPGEAAGRYNQTTVFDPVNQSRLFYLTPPEPLPSLLALQGERTLGMLDRYPDGGGFLPSGRPMILAPLGQLALIGAAYLLIAARRDVRLAILSVWFWLGLGGVLVTVETPSTLRAVGMLPSLCFALAIPLVDLVDRIFSWRPRVEPLLVGVVTAGLAITLVAPEIAFYFTTFRTMPVAWVPMNGEGQIVAKLGATGPVYTLEKDAHMVISGWVRLLSPEALRGQLPNPGRELPALAVSSSTESRPDRRPEIVPAPGQTLSFVLLPGLSQRSYVPLLQQLYPGGAVSDAGDGRLAYQLAPEALAATRGVALVLPDGSVRPVDRFGEIAPGLALPARLRWRAGVRLPRGGTYTLTASAPGPVELRMDEVALGTATGTTGIDVSAAPGLHYLEISAEVASADQRPGLTLTGPDGAVRTLGPSETYRPMDAPWGLLARVIRQPQAQSRQPPGPANAHLDATVSMAFFDPELEPVGPPASLTWTGALMVPRTGVYRMAFAADDPIRLEIDGQRVAVAARGPDEWQSIGVGSEVRLTEGRHEVRIVLDVTHGGRQIVRWNWVPPLATGLIDVTGAWAVVPPMVLRPETPVAVAQ